MRVNLDGQRWFQHWHKDMRTNQLTVGALAVVTESGRVGSERHHRYALAYDLGTVDVDLASSAVTQLRRRWQWGQRQ